MLPAAVSALAASWDPYLIAPLQVSPTVCRICHNPLTNEGSMCTSCSRQPQIVDAVGIVSYSVGGGPWYRALRGYKRSSNAAARRGWASAIAAVLWRYLDAHESCLAAAAETTAFDAVTVVPSSDRRRDADHALRSVVAELCWATRSRHRRLLVPTGDVARRGFDTRCFRPRQQLAGENVLLVEDTWASGGRSQSAAAALRDAGAATTAVVVMGRYIGSAYAAPLARVSYDAARCQFRCERCPDSQAATSPR